MNLPLAIFEQHSAFLGKTGSGKTYAAKGQVERLLRSGERACIVDPTGVWYGLKSKADGKSAAFPIVIFGGEYADFPLSQEHGASIAEIVATSDISVIIDTSLMTVGERTRFFTAFAETLLRKNKQRLHVIIDEAHNFAPQGKVPDPQSAKMLHATNNLVSMGRARGLSIMLISQRPQKLHKDSLTQAATLIAMRLMHPLDRKSIEDWIGDNADYAVGKEIIKSLAGLPTGTGWVWSPELTFLKEYKFPRIETYDSSSPPNGKNQKVILADIDSETIKKKLESVSVEILNNDPKHLKARIKELEARSTISPGMVTELVLAKKTDEAFNAGIEKGHDVGYACGYSDAMAKVHLAIGSIEHKNNVPPPERIKKLNTIDTKKIEPAKLMPYQEKAVKVIASTNTKMSSGERKILTVLANFPKGRTKKQIALLAVYALGGGAFNNYLSSLNTKGWMQRNGDLCLITDRGSEVLGPVDQIPTGRELQSYWLSQLGKAERSILETLCNAYPNSLTKEDLAVKAGYEPKGGGFNNAISRLRTLELIEGRGELSASEDLF